MNRCQKVVVVLGCFVFAYMVLCPPFVATMQDRQGYSYEGISYDHFLRAPDAIVWPVLMAQCAACVAVTLGLYVLFSPSKDRGDA